MGYLMLLIKFNIHYKEIKLMKKTNFIILAVIGLALCFSSCGGGGGSDSDESPYVSFSTTSYNSGGKWEQGFNSNDPNLIEEPLASFRNSWTSCIGAPIAIEQSYFTPSDGTYADDYVYVAFKGDKIDQYSGDGECKIIIRYSKVKNPGFITLTTPTTVNITKYNDDVIEGNFSGTNSGNNVTGKFLFRNLGANKWYFTTQPYPWNW